VNAVCVATFNAANLERVFAGCFAAEYNTRLVGGASEPLYQPAPDGRGEHLVFYREDYFASALHEVAHWCIAGPGRRRQVDFGYWYAPDGRTAAQQRAFERVEYKPQALEWLFSRACGFPFSVSLDNLDGEREPDSGNFRRAIFAQAQRWQRAGLPARAARFFDALSSALGPGARLADLRLSPAELGL
jgi:elongation factor P hydroxylase